MTNNEFHTSLFRVHGETIQNMNKNDVCFVEELECQNSGEGRDHVTEVSTFALG